VNSPKSLPSVTMMMMMMMIAIIIVVVIVDVAVVIVCLHISSAVQSLIVDRCIIDLNRLRLKAL